MRVSEGIKGWVWATLLLISVAARADELAVGPVVPLELSELTTNATALSFIYPGVAVSGASNAIFYWNQRGGDNPGEVVKGFFMETNVFMSRLDADARPIDNPGLRLFTAPFIRGQARIVGADSGFFSIDARITSNLARSPTNIYVGGFGANGALRFEPYLLSTNAWTYEVASNGRTLLYVQRNRYGQTNGLDFKLLTQDGAVISQGTVEGSTPRFPFQTFDDRTYAVASDGRDYLLVWESRTGPYVRATRFAGDTGAYTTLGYTNSSAYIQALGYGKNGYLLFTPGTSPQLKQLANDGTEIARTNLPSGDLGPAVIYPEGEGWVVFIVGSQLLSSYRVTPAPGKLVVGRNPYPVVNGSTSPNPENAVVPFGPGRYLVASLGVSILTKAGLTPRQRPQNFDAQTDQALAASPFGYLAVWNEAGAHSMRGLRLAPDGTPLDAHSFVIATIDYRRPLQCVFDGQDYVVLWANSYPTPPDLARISPIGAPDVRIQRLGLPEGIVEVSLIVHQKNLFAYLWENGNVRAWQIFPNGAAGPEFSAPGQYLVSDGANLFTVGVNDQFEIFRRQIGSGATTIIAPGGGTFVSPLNHGFVVQWNTETNSEFAYFSNGAERLRSQPAFHSPASFADSDDRLLVVSRDYNFYLGHRYVFKTYNLQTGATATNETDLGTLLGWDLASAGKDFLVVTHSLGPITEYTGKFWITTADAPAFTPPQLTNTDLKSTLLLNPDRRYRIETSPDLFDWSLEQVVSGFSQFSIERPLAGQGFIRAILVPE